MVTQRASELQSVRCGRPGRTLPCSPPPSPHPRPATPKATQNSGSAPRTRDAAPTTLPPPIRRHPASTQLAPIHTSSPMHDAAAARLEPLRRGSAVADRRTHGWSAPGAVRRDQHVAADADAVAGVQHAAGVDHLPRPITHVAAAAGRLDLDEGVDDHVVLDDDAAAAHANPRCRQAREMRALAAMRSIIRPPSTAPRSAPFVPQRAVGVLDAARQAGGVAQRRGCDAARAAPARSRRQRVDIRRGRDRARHVGVGVGRSPSRPARPRAGSPRRSVRRSAVRPASPPARPATAPRSSSCRRCAGTDRARCRSCHTLPRCAAAARCRSAPAARARRRARRTVRRTGPGMPPPRNCGCSAPAASPAARCRMRDQAAIDAVVQPLRPAEMPERDAAVGRRPAAARPAACPSGGR